MIYEVVDDEMLNLDIALNVDVLAVEYFDGNDDDDDAGLLVLMNVFEVLCYCKIDLLEFYPSNDSKLLKWKNV